MIANAMVPPTCMRKRAGRRPLSASVVCVRCLRKRSDFSLNHGMMEYLEGSNKGSSSKGKGDNNAMQHLVDNCVNESGEEEVGPASGQPPEEKFWKWTLVLGVWIGVLTRGTGWFWTGWNRKVKERLHAYAPGLRQGREEEDSIRMVDYLRVYRWTREGSGRLLIRLAQKVTAQQSPLTDAHWC